MYVLTVTDGTGEQIAGMLEGVAEGFRNGSITDDPDREFGTLPVWANDGQLVGYLTAIAEHTS